MARVSREIRMKTKIWLSSPHMGGSEQTFVKEAFDLNWIAPLGPHVNGFEADLQKIQAVANKYGIPVIEDAAEALGAQLNGKMCGSFGQFGILSFNGNKIITTSGGGALLSADVELVQKPRFLATQARDEAPHYQHSHIGYNYRMSNVVAAIGR